MERIERILEAVIFSSRWLMAPFYIGLIAGLAVLFIKFFLELIHYIQIAFSATESDIILGVLSLIDLALTGNLVLIVIFSGYENFVSRIEGSYSGVVGLPLCETATLLARVGVAVI